MIDMIEYMRRFPYWEYFKMSTYYFFSPIEHSMLVVEGKSIMDKVIEKQNKEEKEH